MAKKITDLTAITSAASGDLLAIVDVSDTTQAATGSTRKITAGNLLASPPAVPTDITVGSTRAITTDELHGQLLNFTGAYTGSLPTCVAGLSGTPFSSTAAAISVDVTTGTDVIVLDGTALTAGNKITSDGTIDAAVHIRSVSIGGTYKYIATTMQGIWIDGGA